MNATTPKERADKLKNDITLLKSGSSFTSIIRPKQEFNKNSKISVLTSKMPEKRGRRRTRSPVKDDNMVDEDSVEFQLGTINPDEDTYLEPESGMRSEEELSVIRSKTVSNADLYDEEVKLNTTGLKLSGLHSRVPSKRVSQDLIVESRLEN